MKKGKTSGLEPKLNSEFIKSYTVRTMATPSILGLLLLLLLLFNLLVLVLVSRKHLSFFGKTKRREILGFLTYRHSVPTVVCIPTERGPLLTQTCTDLHPTCATFGDLEPLPLEMFNEILRYSPSSVCFPLAQPASTSNRELFVSLQAHSAQSTTSCRGP